MKKRSEIIIAPVAEVVGYSEKGIGFGGGVSAEMGY